MERPKRVAIIGYDAPVMPRMQQYIDEGHLPNLKRVWEGGTLADNCLVPYPTITPPNWTTIATGAHLGTHGITDFSMPIPGKTPDQSNLKDQFDTARIKAETIWEAMDRAGKKAIVFNWPTSWPSRMKNGIVVGGAGLSPAEFWAENTVCLCDSQLISTKAYRLANQAKFEPAEGWKNVDTPGAKPLQMAVRLEFPRSDDKPAPLTWHVLARNVGGAGYDTVTLAPLKDMAKAYCTLKVGEWSPTVWETFRMADGRARKAFFRVKLMELSADAGEFRLWVTPITDQTPLVNPPELADKLVSAGGVPILGGFREGMMGSIDFETFGDNLELYCEYVADLAVCLIKDGDWDGFFMHSHPPDITYHLISGVMDPDTNPDEKSRAEAWTLHLRMYKAMDKMLGRILEKLPKDTLTVMVSDHGALPDGPIWNAWYPLVDAGLVTATQPMPDLKEASATGSRYDRTFAMNFFMPKYEIKKTRALPGGTCHLYVNLKGRYPDGIVDPADLEKTKQEIIDTLYSYVDPVTGKRPICLALTKEDARILGLYGDGTGDVVYAVYPEFSNEHGNHLPTARVGIGDQRGMWVFNGPGVKKGQRLQRTVHLEDIVPTVCHLTGLPLPKDVDGAVVNQVFKDPDFMRKDAAKMRDGLGRMEAAMARKTRQPWDKHDCA